MKKQKKVSKTELKKKKISFISAIFLVIGSTIGAGIFLKNHEILGNVGGSWVLTLVSWILSIFAIICMGVSLTEVASATTNSNLGSISWVKNFCHKYIYKAAKNFMAFLYLPLNFIIMPYYAVLQFQDAFGWQTQWWIAAIIALAIGSWFFIVSGLSSKFGNIQNWIVTSVKFVPLAFCVIAGITLAATGNGWTTGEYIHILPVTPDTKNLRLIQLAPTLGIIGSIPAIIFSYDGFYTAAGIQSEMEEPKKTPLAIVIGLLIVSLINLLIAVSLLFGSKDGKVTTLGWFDDNGFHWVVGVIQIMIAIGVFGIVNGFAIYNPLFYQDLIKEGELPFAHKLKSKVLSNKNNSIGLIYAGVITLVFFVLFTLIGALAYRDVNNYSQTTMTAMDGVKSLGYDVNELGPTNSLYSFVDLVANWASTFVFLFISFAIIGAMINRKTNKVKVTKVKGFMWCSIIATVLIDVTVLFIVISSIANIFLVYQWPHSDESWSMDMLGTITTLVTLVAFVLICCVPSAIEMRIENKKKSALNKV